MKTSTHQLAASSVLGAALLCLLGPLSLWAQSYTIRPTCSPKGQCRVKTETFGFNDTNWRQWPVQPRPEESDPKTVGAIPMPTPPAIPEQQLPHAESLPAKPPLSGSEILPALTPGATATPNLIDGGATSRPNGARHDKPAGPEPKLPGMPGIGIPGGGFDLPGQPDSKPKTDGPGFDSLAPPKAHLPGTLLPETLLPNPGAPAADPIAPPAKDGPAPKSPVFSPDSAPAPKPEGLFPGTPIKGSSLPRRRRDAVAARAAQAPHDLPMQANWNASLEPDVASDNNLRSASFEQRASENANPLRKALGGYCPVQLQEHDRWVAGNADFQTSYQGQVFHFSSEAAQKRFEAAPEKYVPAQSGNDVVLTAEESRTVAGSINHSAVWHGRLYLFSSSATLAMFQEDPTRYVNGSQHATLRLPSDPL